MSGEGFMSNDHRTHSDVSAVDDGDGPDGTVAMSPQFEASFDRYLANRFDWAAPGDQQEDAWLVRFCDKDCGEAIFTGPDAEREAWEYWNRYAPSYNIYVFRLARLRPESK